MIVLMLIGPLAAVIVAANAARTNAAWRERRARRIAARTAPLG